MQDQTINVIPTAVIPAGKHDPVSESNTPCDQQQRDWKEILAPLMSEPRASDIEITDALVAATNAAEHQLQNSGFVDLLRRARDSALSGSSEAGRKAALGVLEFHQTVQQRRGKQNTTSTSGECLPAL